MANRPSWLREKILVPWWERRARSIPDPVRKLRYLRSAVGADAAGVLQPGGPSRKLPNGTRWLAVPLVVLGALLSPQWLPTEVQAGSPRVLVVNGLGPIVADETAEEPQKVWMVESRAGEEWYSNGLRIDTSYETSNTPRKPVAIDRETRKPKDSNGFGGIVFHSTESLMVPFDAARNPALRAASRALLQFVQRQRCYHYLIDRFGRVYRVVKEDDSAWHAGESIWGDGETLYLGLNDTFLGIALEAATKADIESGGGATPAQIDAARLLTALLRTKYEINPWNCVTHAQVSLNSSNFLIGVHTDFAANFPFAQVGLPDNYGRIYPSITDFGFNYNDVFLKSTGTRMLTGLALSEDKLRRDAASRGIPLERHRAHLQEQFRSTMVALTVNHDAAEGKDKDKDKEK